MNYDEISKYINYDPVSGKLFWKMSRGSRKAGDEANTTCEGYITIKVNKCSYKGHRIAWLLYYGDWPRGFIDHINQDRSDNRIVNLRDCNRQQNNSNVANRADNRSGVKGVSWKQSHGRWCAQISFQGKILHLGLFDCLEEAARVVRDKREELHKEFANHG